jgi:hypothetical protein
MKRCPDCGGKPKPLSDFYRSKRNRDGHGRLCKTCTYDRVRAWQRAHPDQVREQQRRFRLRHFGPRTERKPPTDAELRARRERRKESQREYRRTHREEFHEWRRAYRKKHIRRIRAYYRNYYLENRDHLLELKAKYRQKRRADRNKKKHA